jgi:hypothetical protein
MYICIAYICVYACMYVCACASLLLGGLDLVGVQKMRCDRSNRTSRHIYMFLSNRIQNHEFGKVFFLCTKENP